MNLKPMFDRVLVRPSPKKTKTISGITLSDDESNLIEGEVVSCGDGIAEDGIFIKMEFSAHEKVLFEEHTAIKIDYNESLYLIKQCDILAKIEE